MIFTAIASVLLYGQFGNANVQWDNAKPTVTTPTAAHHAPTDHASLQQLSTEALTGILSGLHTTCDTCETHGHYVSRIRSACLALGPKALKAQLALRGVRCEGCTMREHFLDRVMDTIHMPSTKNK